MDAIDADTRPNDGVHHEELLTLLAERFGEDLRKSLPSSETIRVQLRHRSVRKFASKPVDDSTLEIILRAAQAASHSSNLQAWSTIVIRDPERRARIAELLGGAKPYVNYAPVFLVWVADLHRATSVLDRHGQEMATIRYLEGALVPFIDIGIAAQNALLAAESLGLGGVFVGGLRNNPPGIVRELDLPARTFPAVGMAIGYPDPSEEADIKPRLETAAIVHYERYRADEVDDATERYEGRIAKYYERFGVENYSWFQRLIARLGPREGLNGRHELRRWLADQGFPTE